MKTWLARFAITCGAFLLVLWLCQDWSYLWSMWAATFSAILSRDIADAVFPIPGGDR